MSTKSLALKPTTASLVPVQRDVVAQMQASPWWKKVDDDARKTLIDEAQGLTEALRNHGFSNLAIAERFHHIYVILGPLKLFERFIHQFHFKRRTVYRYLKAWDNAQRLPQAILKAAMARNMNVLGESEERPFGIYTEAIKRLPPPKNLDDAKALAYLKDVEAKRRSLRPKPEAGPRLPEIIAPLDPTDLQIRAYRETLICWQRLPRTWSSDKKIAWIKALVAFQLSIAGLKQDEKLEIVTLDPPAEFIPKVGRPRKH